MPLTGTAKPAKAAAPALAGHRLVQGILDQLDSEWDTLKLDDPALHGDDAGLLAYYHVCVRSLLQQVGDPYSVTFPPGYVESERLPKLCSWLVSLQGQEGQPVKQAREQMVKALRAAWPAYRDLAVPEIPNGQSWLEQDVLPFTWAAIESNWNGEDDDPNRTRFLPTFATRASADFHLAALGLLMTNRQARYYLTDLHPHQTHDGRN